jgi:ATP-dependent Clp protease ATP-binding subunit ClpC
MSIRLTKEAREFVAEEGTDMAFGARPLRRAIQRLLEDPISEGVLEGRWENGKVIVADFKDDDIVFSLEEGEIPKPRERDTLAREAELITPVFKGARPKAGKPGNEGSPAG